MVTTFNEVTFDSCTSNLQDIARFSFTCEWFAKWVCLGLSESRVPLNRLVNHHVPYENCNFGINISDTQVSPAFSLPAGRPCSLVTLWELLAVMCSVMSLQTSRPQTQRDSERLMVCRVCRGLSPALGRAKLERKPHRSEAHRDGKYQKADDSCVKLCDACCKSM